VYGSKSKTLESLLYYGMNVATAVWLPRR